MTAYHSHVWTCFNPYVNTISRPPRHLRMAARETKSNCLLIRASCKVDWWMSELARVWSTWELQNVFSIHVQRILKEILDQKRSTQITFWNHNLGLKESVAEYWWVVLVNSLRVRIRRLDSRFTTHMSNSVTCSRCKAVSAKWKPALRNTVQIQHSENDASIHFDQVTSLCCWRLTWMAQHV